MSSPRVPALGTAAAAVSAVTFGCLGLFTQSLYTAGYTPERALAIRFVIAAVVMACVQALISRNKPRIPWRDHAFNMVMGAAGYGVAAQLFFVSILHTSTGIANVLLFQNPLVVFLLAWVFGGTKPSTKQLVCLIAAIAGVVMICQPDSTHSIVGIGAGIASAIWYGAYLYLSEPRARRFSSVSYTSDVLTGSALAFGALAVLKGDLALPNGVGEWQAAVGLGVFATVVPVLTLFLAMERVGAKTATQISLLEPIVAVGLGAAFLNESLSPLQIAGAMVILLGITALQVKWGTSANKQPLPAKLLVINQGGASKSTLAYWNGSKTKLEDLRVSVEDRTMYFGDAVYEVIRVYDGIAWLDVEHFNRLERSLAKVCIGANMMQIRQLAIATIADNRIDEGYIYIQVSRGSAPRNHAFPADISANVLIYAKPFVTTEPWSTWRETGIAAILHEDIRRLGRDIKSVNLLPNCLAKQAADEGGAQKAILVDQDGLITDASANNVFLIKDDVLRTAPADRLILGGITRAYLLDAAKRLGIETLERSFTVDELRSADCLFISSATSELLKVSTLDGIPFASSNAIYDRLRAQLTFDITSTIRLSKRQRSGG